MIFLYIYFLFKTEDLESEMCERLASDNEDLRKVITNLKSEISLRDKRRKELDCENEELREVMAFVSSITRVI